MKEKTPWIGMVVLAFAAGWGWGQKSIPTVEQKPDLRSAVAPVPEVKVVMPSVQTEQEMPQTEMAAFEKHFAQFAAWDGTGKTSIER